jgi:hypothetical protein
MTSQTMIAVSVDSIGNVPAGRTQAIAVRAVTSDHMSYFTTEAVLEALAEALHVGVSVQR